MTVEGEVNVASVAPEVRIPIELSPLLQRRLAQWCRDTADLLDVDGVGRGEVIEALIDQLVEDSHTGEAVRDRLVALAGYRPVARTAIPPARRPASEVGGAQAGQRLTRRVGTPSTVLAAVPVTSIGHHKSPAGRPVRLGAVTEWGARTVVDDAPEGAVDALGA